MQLPRLTQHVPFAAKGHTNVLQAAVEAVKLGTKESVHDADDDDMSIKHIRAWSKLLKDCLNQKAGRGETAVMVACEEGSVFLVATPFQ